MATKVFIKLVCELDPGLWGDVDELTDEEVLELAAEDWLSVLEGAEKSVERWEQPVEAGI